MAALQTLPGRWIFRLAGWLLPVVLSCLCLNMSARAASCADDVTPTADCESLSLAADYINANITSGVTVTSSGSNTPAVKISGVQDSFTNSGTLQGITTGAQGLRINAAVGTLTNTGVIEGYDGSAGILINNSGTNIGNVTTLTNSGQIVSGSENSGIRNLNIITTLTNESGGSITSADSNGLYNAGTITTLENAGTISGATYGINNASDATISTITNSGTISASSATATDPTGILNSGTITTITNSSDGTISGTTYGIHNASSATIGTITNQGTISGDTYGIKNSGTLTTLNNLQGKSSSALTYTGTLPTNYNIIINGTSNYGMLAASTISGTMNFDIYTGSTVAVGTYKSVLSGISASNLVATTGTYSSYPWVLNNRTGSIWDLIIGLSTSDTQSSLTTTAADVGNLLSLKSSAISNGLQYDCPISTGRRLCISGGIRSTTTNVDQVHDAGGLIVMAFRSSARTRVGLFTDQSFYGRVGSNINVSYYNPMVGIFTDWKKNPDGTGLEVKLSGNYQKNSVGITRTVTGYSEAGSGTTSLRSSGGQLTARYGMAFKNGVNLSPYVAFRHIRQWLDAYDESSSSSVSAPLSYSALSSISTTALVGMDVDVAMSNVFHIVASAGMDVDLYTNGAAIVTTSGISGLSAVSLTSTQRRKKASLGSYLLLPSGERISFMGIYQEETYAGMHTLRMTATYAAQF